jgi:mannose-6-phosphate isomerase-like protein (cupin superfamily)
MQAFELGELGRQGQTAGRPYYEFLRVPSLSMGLYELPAGGSDSKQPHTEDEAYYVVSGRALITVGKDERAVAPGSVIYVPAATPHRFHSIQENLSLLVFFAPSEYSQAQI